MHRTIWHQWRFKSGSRWTRWRVFTESTLDEVPDGPGCYVLGLPAGHNVHRLGGTDRAGVIDVGESKNLAARLRALLACILDENRAGHAAGMNIANDKFLQRIKVKPHELRVAWCTAKTKPAAYLLEGIVLKAYHNAFGELPPFNHKRNWSAYR